MGEPPPVKGTAGWNPPASPAYTGYVHARVFEEAAMSADMSPRPAALALVVWYLMRPPLPHLNAPAIHMDAAAPLSRWIVVGTFPTQKKCEAHRANPWDRCIVTNAPRLKK